MRPSHLAYASGAEAAGVQEKNRRYLSKSDVPERSVAPKERSFLYKMTVVE
jgi:hypothetical protein